ncbi:MAG: hypothetical protein ACUVTU_02090 [Desulfurispora sp.]|uniref:hypothetical protein n=1 Tax=Desulfurispora sp. TaxID=3014275 RepID=UPI00404A7655
MRIDEGAGRQPVGENRNRRGRRVWPAALLLLLLLLAGAGYVLADTAQPGGAEDPLVTRSYVLQQVDMLKEQIVLLRRDLDQNKQSIEQLQQKVEQPGAGGSGPAAWQIVELEKGQRLLGGAGCELVLRGGTATVLDPTGNGLSDLTAGTDPKNGSPVPRNHLLLVPRDDGRGLKATASKVWIMYRGSVTIKE